MPVTITNGYCTLPDLKAYARISDTVDDDLLSDAINAASRTIDRYCGRSHGFWVDTVATTREYHADDSFTVCTDDISSTSGLIVKIDLADDGTFNQTLTITTHFLPYPLNAADEVPARPFDVLRMMPLTSYYLPTSMRPGVQVTAKFGWPATPDEVKLATIFQALMLYAAKDARAGIVQASIDGYPTRMSRYIHPQAEMLLADFRKESR